MSARNYLSAREKPNKVEYLPYINQQKFSRRSELPVLSANAYSLNRNLFYPYCSNFSGDSVDIIERSGTPYSDFLSESETGTPDFNSEESDSSAGSVLKRNTEEATRTLADEWERIERTLYNENGEKCTRPEIIEECLQWQQLHPQFRVVGKAIPIPEKKVPYRQIEHEEVIAMNYSDYEQFSESEDRHSQSSTDITPTNSPRASSEHITDTKLSREKMFNYGPNNLSDTFSSLLQITPIHIRTPILKKRQSQSILRSEIASSRWMKSNRPDTSINLERNSAKSYISLYDTRNLSNICSLDRKMNGRINTARLRDSQLQNLYSPESHTELSSRGLYQNYGVKKVSLPPLLLEEERKKIPIASAKKQNKTRKSSTKMHIDRRYN
ncbi:unnamed protein product [Leptosia nina]|uniref:S-antigen protein n=1 Tax=Leptosia nina TaxID=320188 RepID=A0AAV1JAE7_9NEOP